MSQPLPLGPGERDDPGEPLEDLDGLVDYFRAGEKPRSAFRIGTEHEKFGFLRDTRAPLPFDGERGIESILRAIADDEEDRAAHGAWTPVTDRERVIGLSRNGASISLEPGGQLELSGAPLRTLDETCAETGHHLELLKRVCLPRGVGFIGIGFHPTAAWADFPQVPKSRYAIMERYMPTRGDRGLDMMKRTCTVQANFDFSSEADMAATMQTSLLISPVVTAIFANSPFIDGKHAGKKSERAFVWTDTDPDRTGFPASFLRPDFGYQTYLDWVLDVPMYFVRRDGVHHDHAGASFRTFASEGLGGYRATLRDFEDHLTTVFPEVRLKKFIEVRSADCGPWSRICALPALWKGVIYDATARDRARSLMDEPTADELVKLHRDVAIQGYDAQFRGRSVGRIAEELIDVARSGLVSLAAEGMGGERETRFLSGIAEEAARRESFADRLLRLYRDDWGGTLEPLWDDLEFFADRRQGSR